VFPDRDANPASTAGCQSVGRFWSRNGSQLPLGRLRSIRAMVATLIGLLPLALDTCVDRTFALTPLLIAVASPPMALLEEPTKPEVVLWPAPLELPFEAAFAAGALEVCVWPAATLPLLAPATPRLSMLVKNEILTKMGA
jgi:hypothetical protein